MYRETGSLIRPQRVAVEICHVQVIPRSLKFLSYEGTTWFIAFVNDMPLFIFDGYLQRRENETLILSYEMCDQSFLMKRKFDSNILQNIRLALNMPNPTRNRQICFQRSQIIPTVNSPMRLGCKFQ